MDCLIIKLLNCYIVELLYIKKITKNHSNLSLLMNCT